MACVPPRAGSDTTRKFPIAQGVPLSMKQILVRSSLWHKSCRGWPPVWSVRSRASQAVVVEEMEAIEASEGSEKKTMRWQRWQAHETMALIAAKKQQDLRSVESTEAAGIESKKTKNKWKEVEAFCREKGIERSAQQCQARWSRLMSAFTQIRSWEETRKPEQPSFWSLKLDERKTMGFLLSLDQKAYNALDELYNSKANAIENALFKDNVEEVVELGSVNQMLHGYDGKNNNANKVDVNCSRVQGGAHEVNNKSNSHTSGYKSDEMVHSECLSICKLNGKVDNERYVRHADDNFLLEELEECKGEKQVVRQKAMESTKILSEFLQMVVDDSAGKMDFYPTNLQTGQQVESLKVSGIADHTNSLILCDQKDVNDKAQLLTASAEMSDGSSCKGPLVVVDECNEAQLLHANAENVDCNPTNLNTGQHEESLKFFGIAEHMNSKIGCDQKDANDKAQILPASAKMIIDGSNKDLCKGSLEEHGAEETVVMRWDDDNVPFPRVMDDETMQAAMDKGIEKDADGSLSKTIASVMDSLIVGGIANANSVSASVEESCECQNSKSHLSSTEVHALNANQSRQISDTALSCISIDKEDFKNYSEDRILAEEVCIDKNEKGEEVKSILCPKNAEDISTAWADNIQSSFIETQNKNVACQTGEGTVAQLNNLDPMMDEAYVRPQMVPFSRFEEQQGDLNPLLASKEEIGTSVLKQVPEDNSPRSKIFESICSDQDQDSHIRLSEEGHVEMIAVMTEGNAECSTGHSFEEKKVKHLQNGNNEYNEKTTETSQTIKHFEVAVKDTDVFVKKEPCDELQPVYGDDGGDTIERPKVAIEKGDFLTGKIEIRASTADTNPPALTCIQHQFQHAGSASEQKSTIKGDGGSFESVCESNRAEVLEVAAKEPKELEFTIKDDRGSPVTSGKGSIEDQNTTASTKADDDVLLYIPAATGNFVRSALQIVRNFFKF